MLSVALLAAVAAQPAQAIEQKHKDYAKIAVASCVTLAGCQQGAIQLMKKAYENVKNNPKVLLEVKSLLKKRSAKAKNVLTVAAFVGGTIYLAKQGYHAVQNLRNANNA